MHHSNTMITYVFLVCFATAVLGVPHPPKARIAGGHDADIQQYPYHVQLHELYSLSNGVYDTSFLNCNGAIISPKHVLTTAKCINPFINGHVNPSTILVKVNASAINKPGEELNFVKVKNYTLHPLHTNKNSIVTVDYNIGVLELAEPLTFGPGVQPIGLPKSNESAAIGSVLSVTGFGATHYSGMLYQDAPLQALQMVVVDNVKCAQDFIGDVVVTDRQICTSSVLGEYGDGPCYGDDASPAAFEGVLHGLYAFGECGHEGHGSVYTNVNAFVQFVNDAMAASN